MKILYHAQGKTRKELADAISTITGAAKVYQGIPSYAYEIDCFTVDATAILILMTVQTLRIYSRNSTAWDSMSIQPNQ